jgi:hypothetical protein
MTTDEFVTGRRSKDVVLELNSLSKLRVGRHGVRNANAIDALCALQWIAVLFYGIFKELTLKV